MTQSQLEETFICLTRECELFKESRKLLTTQSHHGVVQIYQNKSEIYTPGA